MTNGSSSTARPHRGTLILVLGILGIFLCMPLGIAAWVMGNADLKAMADGHMDRAGEGSTNAGKICGIISVALWGLTLLVWLLIAVVFVSAGVAVR